MAKADETTRLIQSPSLKAATVVELNLKEVWSIIRLCRAGRQNDLSSISALDTTGFFNLHARRPFLCKHAELTNWSRFMAGQTLRICLIIKRVSENESSATDAFAILSYLAGATNGRLADGVRPAKDFQIDLNRHYPVSDASN